MYGIVHITMVKHDKTSAPSNAEAVRRLLIVDDEAPIGEFVLEVASTIGIDARAVTSGEQFGAEFPEFKPTLVSLDLEMQGEGGIELIAWMAEQSISPQVLLMSGNPALLKEATVLSGTHGLEVIGVMQKPARLKALREVLSQSR